MSTEVPFTYGPSDAEIEDLRDRLRRANWPERETVDDWSQGVPLARDQMLDDVSLYWFTATGASSARLYWESLDRFSSAGGAVDVPAGFTTFPKEIVDMSRRWAENRFSTITYWSEVDRGGHFAAFEQPDLFVDELRRWYRPFR
jgi:epoxide hydrolase